MSIHSRILDVHNKWLTDKGYEEDSIDAVEPPGTFVVSLQGKIIELVVDTFLSDKPVEFTLPMQGYFNDRRDKVLFEFRYSYDPDRPKLQLIQLTARLEGTVLEFPIWNNSPKDLPPATKVYQKLFLKSKVLPPVQAQLRAQPKASIKR